ncbi:hypothetical protein GTY54_49405 [Streptomyces sp. SID625]|nr:hypothetical protein [Streptomyces sp. SID625]MYR63894.1 hypothetical protein [Streptomyces sp. SID625]
MTDSFDPQRQPRVPGVRYRTETRTRQVPGQVFGDEVIEEEEYTVDVPLPPRNWDRIWMRLLLAIALGLTAVTIVWSTSSISKLLRLIGTEKELAVAAGASFELAWIVCLIAEELLRGQPARVLVMKKAGWGAVWFVVAAVVAQGIHAHEVVAGIFGGLVSLMAKGVWWVVQWVRQPTLRPRLARWLQGKLEDTAAAEALLAYKHRIGGRQAYAALVFGEDQFRAAHEAVQAAKRAHEIPSEPRPDPSGRMSVPVQQPAPPVAFTPSGHPVPAAQPQPQASAPVPAQAQAPAPTEPVTPPAPPAGRESGSNPGPSGQAPQSPAPQVAQFGPSIRQTVITALNEDEDMPENDLVDRVRKVHGDRPKLAETVATYRRKEMKKRRVS